MKKIEAIIRKTKFEDVKDALLEADIATTASVTETARPKNARKSISYPSLSA